MNEYLKRIYAACNSEKPATPQYYTDCEEARGETGLARRFLSHLEGASDSTDYIRFLFSGHVGCGKSSELNHLCHLLKQSAGLYDDIILVFDNLEKIQKFEEVKGGLDSHRELFLERYAQLTGLQVHTIYTIPLRLVRSADGPQLRQRYGHEPFVLPTDIQRRAYA